MGKKSGKKSASVSSGAKDDTPADAASAAAAASPSRNLRHERFLAPCNGLLGKEPKSGSPGQFRTKSGRVLHYCPQPCVLDEYPWLCSKHRAKFLRDACELGISYPWFNGARIPVNSAFASDVSEDALLSDDALSVASSEFSGEEGEGSEVENPEKLKGARTPKERKKRASGKELVITEAFASLQSMLQAQSVMLATVTQRLEKLEAAKPKQHKQKRRNNFSNVLQLHSATSSGDEFEDELLTEADSKEAAREAEVALHAETAEARSAAAGKRLQSLSGGGWELSIHPDWESRLHAASLFIDAASVRELLPFSYPIPWQRRPMALSEKVQADKLKGVVKAAKIDGRDVLQTAKSGTAAWTRPRSYASFNMRWEQRAMAVAKHCGRTMKGERLVAVMTAFNKHQAMITQMTMTYKWEDISYYSIICELFWWCTHRLITSEHPKVWTFRPLVGELKQEPAFLSQTGPPKKLKVWPKKNMRVTCKVCKKKGWTDDQCPRCLAPSDESALRRLQDLIAEEGDE